MELAIWTHCTIFIQGKSFWSRDHNPAMKLIFLSVVIHLILFFSIFDIYFRSPVEHGMVPQEASFRPPPAKRVALLVADGLRADTFFSVRKEGTTLAPYLRSIIENKGVFSDR